MTVDYYFDPACPWTWYTATWIDTVAAAKGLEIHCHPMSLWEINNHEVPDEHREPVLMSLRALRLTQALDAAGDYKTSWRYYRELGTRIHDQGRAWSTNVIAEAASAAGIEDLAPLNDESLDTMIAEVTVGAMQRGGQDIGSPLLVLPGIERGFHGPIVDKNPMSADEAVRLWEAVQAITAVPAFYEIKHGRG